MFLELIYNHVIRKKQWNIGFHNKSLETLMHIINAVSKQQCCPVILPKNGY